ALPVKGNRFAADIAATAPVGDCDVWAVTAKGLTNPRRFAVGSLPQSNEKEPNDEPESAQAVKLPVVINGSLNPGTDRDYYRFDAGAGQRVTFHFRSGTLDGSARASLTLF